MPTATTTPPSRSPQSTSGPGPTKSASAATLWMLRKSCGGLARSLAALPLSRYPGYAICHDGLASSPSLPAIVHAFLNAPPLQLNALVLHQAKSHVDSGVDTLDRSGPRPLKLVCGEPGTGIKRGREGGGVTSGVSTTAASCPCMLFVLACCRCWWVSSPYLLRDGAPCCLGMSPDGHPVWAAFVMPLMAYGLLASANGTAALPASLGLRPELPA